MNSKLQFFQAEMPNIIIKVAEWPHIAAIVLKLQEL